MHVQLCNINRQLKMNIQNSAFHFLCMIKLQLRRWLLWFLFISLNTMLEAHRAPEAQVSFILTAHGGDGRDNYRVCFSGHVDAQINIRQAAQLLLRNRARWSFEGLANRLLVDFLLQSSPSTMCQIYRNMLLTPLSWETIVSTISGDTVYINVHYDKHESDSDSSNNSATSM
jgi:hypothetical protein